MQRPPTPDSTLVTRRSSLVILQSRLVGEIAIECPTPEGWRLSAELAPGAAGEVERLDISMEAPDAARPPAFEVRFGVPLDGAAQRWTWASESCALPPDWGCDVATNIASGVPVCAFVRQDDSNRITAACSETARVLHCHAGVNEETACLRFKYVFFSSTEAPIRSYRATIRIDARRVHFADAVRGAAAWLDSLPGNAPCPPPPAAFEPLYSTWYGFHHNVFADQIEAECTEAAKDGMKVLIVDDGWETDDNHRGFAFTGDWEVSPNRFPDMRAHVARIHALGMKYMVWFAVPLVGFKSRNYARFAGKYLYDHDALGASVLDPRFPDVREFIASTYERAIRDWDIDGLKLDFIETFRICGDDPAEREGYAGRDFTSVTDAVQALFADLRARLGALRPGLLVEFRQHYVGPAIRTFGNMMRAADCPACPYANHVRIANLRLTSGVSAVHSDMLEWHPGESVESAARQVLASLFGVIQYSMRLLGLPPDHHAMIRHWIAFTTAHRRALLQGGFLPHGATAGYTSLEGWDDDERVVAVYASDTVCDISDATRTTYVVNATPRGSLPLRLAFAPVSADVFDTLGRRVGGPALAEGLQDADIPSGGYIALRPARIPSQIS